MKLLRDFPVLRLVSDAGGSAVKTGGFAEAQQVHWRDVAKAARVLATAEGASTVLLIEPHVAPTMEAEAVAVDQALCDFGEVIRYPARSVVTGLHLPHGLLLAPIKALEDAVAALPSARLTTPHGIGTFTGNQIPEIAFETGFLIASRRTASSPPAARRLALSASLGTDALNGPWWVLGSLAGLLRKDSLGEAWVRHEALLSRPRDIQRHISGEARRVRLETGLPVQELSQDQSRVMKAMLPDWTAEDIWQDYISGCRALGTDGGALADRYEYAVRYIWPGAA